MKNTCGSEKAKKEVKLFNVSNSLIINTNTNKGEYNKKKKK